MNRLEFTAALIGSLVALAWPAAVVILVLAFRTQIRDSLKELMGKESGQIEAWMLKAQWEAKADAIEADMGDIDPGRVATEDQPTVPREIRDPGMVSTGKQMITIYNVLKDELEARNVAVTQFHSLEAVSAVAVAEGILEPDDHKLLIEIARLVEDLAKVPATDREPETTRVLRLAATMARHIVESTERARSQRLNLDQ
jgi:hypothetical protein